METNTTIILEEGATVEIIRGNRAHCEDLIGKTFTITELRTAHDGGDEVLLDGWLIAPIDWVRA